MTNENATSTTTTNANAVVDTQQSQPLVQESKAPTVEELMAQLASERAEKEKNKLALDKALKEKGDITKQLRAKQTAEEQEAEAKAEADRVRDEELKNAKAELNHIRAVNAYKAIADEKAVEKLIEAVSDADHNAIATIIANECKKAVAEAEAQWLKDRPQVQHGQYSGMSKEQIMAMTDRTEKLKAIALNRELFN